MKISRSGLIVFEGYGCARGKPDLNRDRLVINPDNEPD